MDADDGTDGLALTVEPVGAPVARRAALLAVRVANRGGSPLAVSGRLNLFEGDIRLICRGPSGEERRFAGWQIDTLPDPVELPPGRAIVGVVNLLESADGPILGESGPHAIAAEYLPAVTGPWLASPPVQAEVAAPGRSDEDSALDALLADRWLRRALVKADAREAPEAMDRLAAGFPERLEGELALLIVAGGRGEAGKLDWEKLAARDGIMPLAMRLLALRTPYSEVGARLAEAYAAALGGLAADPGERETARQIVMREPVPA